MLRAVPAVPGEVSPPPWSPLRLAPLFPSFNPPLHATNLSPPCHFLQVTMVGSSHGHEGHGSSQDAEQPQPHGAARGTASQLGCLGAAAHLPAWTLAPDVSAAPLRSIGASCCHRMPGRAGDLGGAGGTGRSGQHCHFWARDGADPPLLPRRLGWRKHLPKTGVLGHLLCLYPLLHPLCNPRHQTTGVLEELQVPGSPELPKKLLCTCWCWDVNATGRTKGATLHKARGRKDKG